MNGCAYPLKSVEVHELLPGIGRVSWLGRPLGYRGEYIVVGTFWHPGSTARQPTVAIRPVHKEDVDVVREWIEKVWLAEARAWLTDVKNRAPATTESRQWWLNPETGKSRSVGN